MRGNSKVKPITRLVGFAKDSYGKAQANWARGMARLTDRLSKRKLFFVLVAFIGLTNAYCVWLVINSTKRSDAIQVKRVVLPTAPSPGGPSMDELLVGVENSAQFLDSISKTVEGKKVLDSILSPGKIDSIETIKDLKKLIK